MDSLIWSLQDVKAQFDELIRCVDEEGRQRVSIPGKSPVVVTAVVEYAEQDAESRPKRTGQAIVDAFRDPRIRGLKFGRDSIR